MARVLEPGKKNNNAEIINAPMTVNVLRPHLYYMEGVYLCCNESGISSFTWLINQKLSRAKAVTLLHDNWYCWRQRAVFIAAQFRGIFPSNDKQ